MHMPRHASEKVSSSKRLIPVGTVREKEKEKEKGKEE